MSYRMAIFGLIAGMCGLTIFCHQAGMSIVYTWAFFALYFVIAIAVTRLRAEFGAPHGINNHPLDIMVTTLGSTQCPLFHHPGMPVRTSGLRHHKPQERQVLDRRVANAM